MTDVDLDARVTALEENDGGSGQNGNVFYIFRFPGLMKSREIIIISQ